MNLEIFMLNNISLTGKNTTWYHLHMESKKSTIIEHRVEIVELFL